MTIPVIDFDFLLKEGDEEGRKKAVDQLGKACLEFGFLQVINHGLPKELIRRVRTLSQNFFDQTIDQKLECKSSATIPPAGYGRMEGRLGNNEWLMVCEPWLGYNVFPSIVPGIRETMEEMFKHLQKLGEMVECVINEYLGLPPNFLKKLNEERSADVLVCWRYPPLTTKDTNEMGREGHIDSNFLAILLQDDVGGLEYEKDGSWIPIIPRDDALVINLGSIIQVWTNKKMMAAKHRVLAPKGRNRHSIAFFFSTATEKWIEPLPQFTKEIGEAPKYKGFFYKDILLARLKKEDNYLTVNEKVLDIESFAIPI